MHDGFNACLGGKKLRIIRVENSDGDSLGGTIVFNYLLLNNYVGLYLENIV